MTKKIFITGIAGFLGSHLADHFISNGYSVSGCDNLIGGELNNVPAEAEFYQYDCRFRNSMARITKDMDIVYHCACTAYEGLSVFSPHFITENTFGITASLLSACIENEIERFVFCSSMARYGTQDRLPFTEEMQPRPQDPYGIAKYASELTIKSLAEVHEFEYVIAVPHNIIGPRQKYDDPYRNVASIMINLMMQGRQPIIYGDGNQKRSFSFVDDVIYSMDKMATTKGISGEVYNVGPDEEFITINDLAREIADILDFDLKPVYFPDRPQEVKMAACCSKKIREEFGFKTKVTLREGLEKMVEFIREKGPKKFKYHLDIEINSMKTPETWSKRVF